MYLDNETFKTIVSSTPLVSIDLVVRDSQGRVLLGRRNNRPAKSMWFVPGGRIQKNEPVSQAFDRLVENELGIQLKIDQARYLGLYDHFYPDSIWGDEVTTHYVVNAFELAMSLEHGSLPLDQHVEYCWLEVEALLSAPDVHDHTKWYFLEEKGYS